MASVSAVSPLPITQAGANSVVGNPAIVEHLLAQSNARSNAQSNAQIEVFAQLTLDNSTQSGYQWSSSMGPEMEFTPGTTFNAHVVIEERSPITFLLPMLKEWSGL